jgi:hypothetical protein
MFCFPAEDYIFERDALGFVDMKSDMLPLLRPLLVAGLVFVMHNDERGPSALGEGGYNDGFEGEPRVVAYIGFVIAAVTLGITF